MRLLNPRRHAAAPLSSESRDDPGLVCHRHPLVSALSLVLLFMKPFLATLVHFLGELAMAILLSILGIALWFLVFYFTNGGDP